MVLVGVFGVFVWFVVDTLVCFGWFSVCVMAACGSGRFAWVLLCCCIVAGWVVWWGLFVVGCVWFVRWMFMFAYSFVWLLVCVTLGSCLVACCLACC